MHVTRNGIDTAPGPDDWFTGAVYIDSVAAPADGSRLSASSVHFTPGARTAWHTHPNGQTIYVIEGVGLAQRRGGTIEVIRPGDRVFFEPDGLNRCRIGRANSSRSGLWWSYRYGCVREGPP